jgi:hypothetical protein
VRLDAGQKRRSTQTIQEYSNCGSAKVAPGQTYRDKDAEGMLPGNFHPPVTIDSSQTAAIGVKCQMQGEPHLSGGG